VKRAIKTAKRAIKVGTVAKVAALDLCESEEFRILQGKFSSGVTVHELQSIAVILAHFAGIQAPSRREKRNCGYLVEWYRRYWQEILPWLPIIELRDRSGRVIDGRRELLDKKAF
jgi:hypothetical protein